MNSVSRWRIVAALVILAGLLFAAATFAPIYTRNLQLQNFVADLAARGAQQSDASLRAQILERARSLNLPVLPGGVSILRSPQSVRLDVNYVVRVTVPGYTVDLHFHPGAGPR